MDAALHSATQDANMRLLALVDGALLIDMPRSTQNLWASLRNQSLLRGASEEVAAVGPLLYSIPAGRDSTRLPTTLRDETTGRIAGSFITTDQDPVDLAHLLSRLMDVQLHDGTNMIMRFFDPRVLPFWLEILGPTCRCHLAGAVANWIFWRHDFDVQTLRFERAGGEQPLLGELPPPKLTLSAENDLMRACFPLTMIERLRAEDAAALQRVPVPQRYAFFRDQIERAEAHGLATQGELEAYCCTAIEFGATFDEDPQVRTALSGIGKGQTFDEALGSLTNDDWQRVRGAR